MASVLALALSMALVLGSGSAMAEVVLVLAVALASQAPLAPQMHQYHSARSSLDQSRRRVDRKSVAAEDC